ncbi:hypothetical protein SteCoe_5048 [Stentor coeruleus]|uniref:Uncharacterized protein n=1 Tax=Stentor coeruleus TaxID=5963 RepID=A0A1R2CTF2_9CILI|nr:hypothetical protein SteCoe_5048 [Stentor coeruleus]
MRAIKYLLLLSLSVTLCASEGLDTTDDITEDLVLETEDSSSTEENDEELMITDLEGDSPIDFEVIEEGDDEEMEDLDDWIDEAEENMDAVNIQELADLEELEETIEYYELQLQYLENFETVEINSIVYDVTSLQIYIEEMKEYYELRKTDEELAELNEVLDDMENSNDLVQFGDGISEAEDLADEMEPTHSVTIEGKIYTKDRLYEDIEVAKSSQDQSLENMLADLVGKVQGNNEEDTLEEQADIILELTHQLELEDVVIIDNEEYNINELEAWMSENLAIVNDMDSTKDLEADKEDAEFQLQQLNEVSDDYIDEIEELQELLDIDPSEVFVLNGIEYTRADLEAIIEADEEALEQFVIQIAIADLDDLYMDDFTDPELDADDQIEGLEAIEDLIGYMDDDDVVVLDDISFDKQGLIDQLNEANENTENQLMQKLEELINESDLETLSAFDLQNLVEDMQLLPEVMDEGETVDLWGETFDKDEILVLIDELIAMYNSMKEQEMETNEINDIHNIFVSFNGSMTISDFYDLEMEINELQMSFESDDKIVIGGIELDENGIEEFKYYAKIIREELSVTLDEEIPPADELELFTSTLGESTSAEDMPTLEEDYVAEAPDRINEPGIKEVDTDMEAGGNTSEEEETEESESTSEDFSDDPGLEEAAGETEEEAEVVDNTEEEAEVVDNTEEEAEVVDNTEEEAEVVDNTEEEAEVVDNTEEEAEVVDNTEEEAEVVDNTEEEAEVVDNTEEEAEVVDNTEEEAEVVDNTEEEAEVVDNTEEEAEVVDNTEEEAEVVDNTEEEAEVVDNTEEEAEVVDNTEEEAEVVDNTEEEAEVVDNTEEEAEVVDNTEEEAEVVDNTEEEAEVVDNTEEEAEVVDNTEEEAEVVDNTEEEAEVADNTEETDTIEEVAEESTESTEATDETAAVSSPSFLAIN